MRQRSQETLSYLNKMDWIHQQVEQVSFLNNIKQKRRRQLTQKARYKQFVHERQGMLFETG